MAKAMTGFQMRGFICLAIALGLQTACSAKTPTPPSPPPPSNTVASAVTAAATTAESLQPGEYITDKGWGQLQLSRQAEGMAFSIEAVTGEDLCTLRGTIKNARGIAVDDAGPSPCTINFNKGASGIDVSTSTPAECKRFCGYNGSFEATYLNIKDGCSRSAVQQTRDAFKRLYDNKDYSSALATLSPVLTNCLPTLQWEEEGDIRNDLAITQFRNGLHDQCLATLEKYSSDAGKDDDAVTEGWTPALADSYLSIIKAARTNIALCSRKPTR